MRQTIDVEKAITPQVGDDAREIAGEGITLPILEQAARAAFAEQLDGNQKDASIQLVVWHRDVDDGQNGAGIAWHFGDWQIEAAIAVRTDVLEGFDLDGDGEPRPKTPQIEVDTTVDDWAGDGPGAASRGLEADREQILGDRAELRGAERTAPVRTVWWVETLDRIEQGHLPNANRPRAISFSVAAWLDELG